MSAFVTLQCDNTGCPETYQGGHDESLAAVRSEAAEMDGWISPFSDADYCPRHGVALPGRRESL